MIRACLAAWLLLCAIVVTEEVPAELRVTKRFLFVMDRSNSMSGQQLITALDQVRALSEQNSDDFQFGVIAFNTTQERWPGRPEGQGRSAVPPGWAAACPEASAEAQGWLSKLGAGGGTLVTPALSAALLEPRTELTAVLVSDGLFNQEPLKGLLDRIEACQVQRDNANLGRAVIVCIGIGSKQQSLIEIARAGRGGYFRYEDDAPPPAPPDGGGLFGPPFPFPPSPGPY